MKLGIDLTGNKVAGKGADLLPAGNYHVVITETEEAGKNNNIGCKVWMEVVSGQHAGSNISDYLNLQHSNVDTTRIGRDQLKTYLSVTGCPNINNPESTDVLHGKELIVKLDIKPSSFQDSQTGQMINRDQNNVKKRLEFTGTAPADAMPTVTSETPSKSAIADNGAAVFGTANTMMNPTTAAAPAAGKNPWDK